MYKMLDFLKDLLIGTLKFIYFIGLMLGICMMSTYIILLPHITTGIINNIHVYYWIMIPSCLFVATAVAFTLSKMEGN